MSYRTDNVIAGWLNLTAAERREFEEEIGRLRNQPEREQREKAVRIREGVERHVRVSTGPLAEGCLCCGR